MFQALLCCVLLAATVPPELSFTPWFESRGIAVEIARVSSGPPWLRGTGEVPASAEKVGEVLSDFGHYREIFSPAVKTAAMLDRGPEAARLHLVWPYPFPYKNRDAVISYRIENREGGAFTLSWKADPRPGDPAEGTRIQHVLGETRVEPLGADRCRVTYTYLGDLGGKFPAWAQEKAWREEPVQYFRAIRRRLGLPDLPKQ